MRSYASHLTTENSALILSLGRARVGTFAMTAVDANHGFFRITLACAHDCPQVCVRLHSAREDIDRVQCYLSCLHCENNFCRCWFRRNEFATKIARAPGTHTSMEASDEQAAFN